MNLLNLTLLVGLAIPALARPDEEICHPAPTQQAVPGFDATTGRDISTYPPHPIVSYQHMKLTIDIPDMNTPRFSAVQSLTVKPIANPVSTLTLDARLLDIQSVACAGHQTTFKSDGTHLDITFDPALTPEWPAEIITSYTLTDPPAGIAWTPESPAWPGRPAQIHTQGETDTNSFWFPCHDFPNIRLTTELIVTVPAGFTVSSNGREVEPVRRGTDGRDTFHWLQDKPHVNYLVSLIVGKFDIVDVAPKNSKLPLPVYVPPGRRADVARTYGRTPRMVDLFGRLTNQPYPWDRYAQLIVWNFGPGGMENTSATTLYDNAILSESAAADGFDLDGLISHELAHQWFGDLITCRSWEHIWLNEGFATYFSNLWFEERDGADGYQSGVRGNFDSVCGSDHADAPHQRPMVAKTYQNAGQMFGGPANPYPKGSSILHMLRMRLGDELFFRGLSAFVAQYRFKTAETNDLRRVMEDTSGENLDQFFRQWCQRPGVPDLDITIDWKAGELAVAVKQTQKIDGYNPAFDFDLPVWVSEPGATTLLGRNKGPNARKIGVVHCDAREQSARFKLTAEPRVVAIDPDMAVLSRMTIHQPDARWIEQLSLGPTYAARVQACRALGGTTSPAPGLVELARNNKAHPTLRAEAVKSLAARKDAAAIIQLSSARNLPHQAGIELVNAAASLSADATIESSQRARLRDFILNRVTVENNQQVRTAAIRALGTLKATDKLPLVLQASDTTSHNDLVRQAALESLAALDLPEGLPVAIRYSLPGAYNRTRATAIDSLATLAHHDKEASYKILAGLLDDRESRAWHAAGNALVKLNDARAVSDLERLATTKRSAEDKKQVQDWLTALKSKEHASAAPNP